MRRALLFSTLLTVLLVPGVAHGWYVDISITGAGSVSETTDANELDEHCTAWTEEGFSSAGNTPTDSVGASCRAGDAAGDYGSGWIVRYVAQPATGYTFAGWTSDGRTTPGPVDCDDPPGAACQFQIWGNLQVRARFVDDTAPAMSALNGPNQTVNGATTFTFSAVADPTFSHFECRVAGVHEWQTCSSGRQENPGTGSYTFQVRAVDHSGNRSGDSTWTWSVDKVAPETSLAASGPSGLVNSSSANFEFNSNEGGTFRCELDSVAIACSSPKSYTGLAEGGHTFKVWARDVAGNEDPVPASRTWTVDTIAPNTTLESSGPSGSTTATSATFTFGATGGAAAYSCHLTGQAVDANCPSPRSYANLPDGTYTFTVTARDAAGNVDPTPATRTFTVDAPDSPVTPPADPVPSPSTTTGGQAPPPASPPAAPVFGGAPSTSTLQPTSRPAARFAPVATARYRARGARTTVRSLSVKGVPADARVLVTCRGKGKGCPFGRRTVKHKGGTVNLGARLAGRRLRAGAVLEVRITSASGDVRLARWQIRRARSPKLTLRCAPPGGKLGRC